MIYLWYEMSDAEVLALDGRRLWVYCTRPKFMKPKEGILKLEGTVWRFHKIGKKGKGTLFRYYSRLADTEAEAVADYNREIENFAREYDKAAKGTKIDLIPFTGSVHAPVVYSYSKVRAGYLDGKIVYQFHYIPDIHAGAPFRLKPVQIQVQCGATVNRVGKYGKISTKSRYAGHEDYFAETEDDAILKYNELVENGIKQYEKMAAEFRKEKV